jgi:hypothetical protein
MSRFKEEAFEAHKENIIDMGVTFAAMIRLFAKGSKEEIVKMLSECFEKLPNIESHENYAELHESFCAKFVEKINTAPKRLKNGKTKPSSPVSFGQAAKVLDIVIKVYVHYSNLPNDSVSKKVKPFLYGPIDNQILKYLKNKYSPSGISATTIGSVDGEQYRKLQKLIKKDIQARFSGKIVSVEFDDILWKEQNRQNA